MLDRIKQRLENNYEHQQIFLMRDLRFLLKFAEIETQKAEKYWEAANTAELRVQELEEKIEKLEEPKGEK